MDLSNIKWLIKKVKLAGVWTLRILPAKNHFDNGMGTRLKDAVLGGFMVDQHSLYNLDDPENRDKYLSEFDWYRSRYINEPFDRMLDNKIICTEVLGHYIDVPAIYFLKNRGKMVLFRKLGQKADADQDRWATSDDALRLVDEHKTIFMKPLAAGKGIGVYRIDKVGGAEGEYLLDDISVTGEELKAFLDMEDNYFLSQGIRQCEYLNSLYNKTTNTIRLITLRDPESGRFKVFFAVQRIGTKATIPVDNGSQGGLVAKIDLETGELSEAQSLHSLERHKFHPDSGNPIEGVVVPGWDGIKRQLVDLAAQFPFLHFVAWDLLIDENNNVCVIEANKSSGVNIIQLWGPQRQGELGDFYRFHGVDV